MPTRREFLKVAGFTAGVAILNPLRAFKGLVPIAEGAPQAGETRIAIGHTYIYVGNYKTHLGSESRCLKLSLGMANTTVITSCDIRDMDSLDGCSYSISLECIFQKSPSVLGNVGRVESIFFYPNGDFMATIFPKARMDIVGDKFVFTSMPVNSAPWKTMPFGKFYFNTRRM